MFINEQAGAIWQMNGEVWDELSYLAYVMLNDAGAAMTNANMVDAIEMMAGV